MALAFTVFSIVVVAAACLGLVFKKNGELAGLGREHQRGGLRAPHGKLVRTKRLDADSDDTPFTSRFLRLLVVLAALTIVICLLCAFGVFSWEGSAGVGLDLALVIGAAVACSYSAAGAWRPFGFAAAGYLVPGLVLAFCWAAGVPFVCALGTAGVNLLTMVLGTLGCAAAVAWMPVIATYAREFEDGHVNVIQVSERSTACRAYEALADQSWKPPADRVKDPGIANDPRAHARRE